MLTGWRRPAYYQLSWTCLRHKLAANGSFYIIQTRKIRTSARRYEEEGSRMGKRENDVDPDGSRTSGKVSATNVRALSDNSTFLTDEDLKQLVASLTPEQKVTLHEHIQLSHAHDVKQRAEDKLASWRWRSKFGRPASLHSNKFESDPTGTYCEIPVDWLQQKAAELNKPKPPTMSELRQLAIHNALPFIGFGFLDNLIMIVAGDYIDVTIGTGLGISTMAAAALGNTVSDLAGIGSAWYVENIAGKIGIRAPELSQAQLDMFGARWSANMGRGLGVVIGCLIGMFPLLFLPNHGEDKKTQADPDVINKTQVDSATPSSGSCS